MMHRTVVPAAAFAAFALPAHSQDIKLLPTLTMTSYDTGSSGFNMVIAVAKAIKDKHSTDMRVLPAGKHVARLAPLPRLSGLD